MLALKHPKNFECSKFIISFAGRLDEVSEPKRQRQPEGGARDQRGVQQRPRLQQSETSPLKEFVLWDVVTNETERNKKKLLVFFQLWEFDDANDTGVPERLFPPFELQSFVWSGVNLTGDSALLCGADDSQSFSNGSLCLQVRGHSGSANRTTDVLIFVFSKINFSDLKVK